MRVRISLPRVWAEDAEARGVGFEQVVVRTARFVIVDASLLELAEALSDAQYYADPVGFCSSVRPVIRSAQRAVPRIRLALRTLDRRVRRAELLGSPDD